LAKGPDDIVTQSLSKGGIQNEFLIVGQAIELHTPNAPPTGEAGIDGKKKWIDKKEKEKERNWQKE
jgi:hypothetical protein